MPAPGSVPVRRVAVIGAGTIGASWTAWFLSRGLEVVASDPSPDAPALIRRMVEGAWPILQTLGASPDADLARWSFEPDPVKAVAGCDLVQESAPERYEVKQPLLRAISAALPEEVLILCSSSGLLVSRLSEGCTHPGRVVIGHPFNPPHLIPLVEVVGGTTASPEAVAAAVAFYRAIGKHPITLNKEVPGHLANRLQAALWREAVHMVAEGVASVADVDAAISEGPGLRWALMGPHTTFHLAGGEGGYTQYMHHLMPAVTSWWETLGNPVMTPELQQALIAGVAEATGGRPISELAAERDAALTRLLAAKAGRSTP
jgi:3-hydroxyacyl-CoA dehydrogenase